MPLNLARRDSIKTAYRVGMFENPDQENGTARCVSIASSTRSVSVGGSGQRRGADAPSLLAIGASTGEPVPAEAKARRYQSATVRFWDDQPVL